MFSIIISSYNKKRLARIKNNIALTIGSTAFEIIVIHNPGLKGITTAYNEGARQSQYEFLIFIHEDIEFLLENWGELLKECLSLKNLGLLGVAGGTKKFNLPTGHDLGISQYRQVYVTHQKEENIGDIETFHQPIPIKTIDGVFIAMTRNRWTEINFNENIKGFHFYDLDISMRASEKHQNFVIPIFLIRHFSKGKFDNSWIEACLLFHKRDYNFDIVDNYEIQQVRKFWYRRLLLEDISLINRLKYILSMGLDKVSRRDAWNFLFSNKILN